MAMGAADTAFTCGAYGSAFIRYTRTVRKMGQSPDIAHMRAPGGSLRAQLMRLQAHLMLYACWLQPSLELHLFWHTQLVFFTCFWSASVRVYLGKHSVAGVSKPTSLCACAHQCLMEAPPTKP
jgi:hypothetical protein